jgi:hypothetical protein
MGWRCSLMSRSSGSTCSSPTSTGFAVPTPRCPSEAQPSSGYGFPMRLSAQTALSGAGPSDSASMTSLRSPPPASIPRRSRSLRHVLARAHPQRLAGVRISGSRADADARRRRLGRREHQSRSALPERAQPRQGIADAGHRSVDIRAASRGTFPDHARCRGRLRRGGRRARSDHLGDRSRREARPAAQRGADSHPHAFPARLVAAGIDDLGPSSRTVKIALVYESADLARADAALIERDLPSTPLPARRAGRSPT